jgi:hypothetical protein
MPQDIERAGVRQLLDQGAQLVEVLPAEEFKEDHLPGAISVPGRGRERVRRPRPRRRAPAAPALRPRHGLVLTVFTGTRSAQPIHAPRGPLGWTLPCPGWCNAAADGRLRCLLLADAGWSPRSRTPQRQRLSFILRPRPTPDGTRGEAASNLRLLTNRLRWRHSDGLAVISAGGVTVRFPFPDGRGPSIDGRLCS